MKNKPTLTKIKKRNKAEILILHFNCRDILLRSEEIQYIINELDPDIIVFSETWLDESTPEYKIIEGYQMLRKDRTEIFKYKYNKKYGGGVSILHKQSIRIEKSPEVSDDIEDILWARVRDRNGFLLGALYRPDYSDMLNDKETESKLEKNIREVTSISKNYYSW